MKPSRGFDSGSNPGGSTILLYPDILFSEFNENCIASYGFGIMLKISQKGAKDPEAISKLRKNIPFLRKGMIRLEDQE